MTKNDFISRFIAELAKHNTPDTADIVSEYEQHFAFKMADGFTEEEIAAKLGDPVALAAQYDGGAETKKYSGRKITTLIGLCFVDLIAGIFAVILSVWEAVIAAFSLSCGVLAACLIGGMNIYKLLPPIPYGCGLALGVSFIALAILTAIGCVYYAAFLRQLFCSFVRFQHNAIAAASDRPTLPPITVGHRFSAKTNRRLRGIISISLTVFVICFIVTLVLCMLSAGVVQFWHTWGWFGYKAV